MIKRLLIILCLIFSVNSFAQNNEKPKAINEENNTPVSNKPVGNVPTAPNKDIGKEPTISEQLHKGLSRFGDTPSEQIARSYEDIKNKARKKGIRLNGPTQNYSNDAFVTSKE